MKYSNLERDIAIFLSKMPYFKYYIKKYYQWINYMLNKKNYKAICEYSIYKFYNNTNESFFGYYDKSPINLTNEYIIFHSTNCPTNQMPKNDVPVDIILYNCKRDKYQVIDSSYSYNWQQGSRLFWVNSYRFIYNTYNENDDEYRAKIYDVVSETFKILKMPVYDCYKDKFGITVNFDRLNIARKDYGYGNRKKPVDWSDYENDGIYFLDIEKNQSEIILSFDEIIQNRKDRNDYYRVKFNHIMISPDGQNFIFIFRWWDRKMVRHDALYAYNLLDKKIKMLADDGMVSHCAWLDNENIIGYLRDKKHGDRFYKINIINNVREVLKFDKNGEYGDGHITIYGQKMCFDSYPNRSRMQELYLYDISENNIAKIGEFFESFKYNNETRCDLHPRFSYDGSKIFIDSVHEEKRYLYMIDLKQLKEEKCII